MKTLLSPSAARRALPFVIAGSLLCLAYAYHVYVCAQSAMFYFPYVYKNSDMHANLLWAKSIQEQGWLNPNPHHPYADWMRQIGTFDEWRKWWGGTEIYQQSPLYAYFLAGMQWLNDDLIFVLAAQAVFAVGLCVCLGLITTKVSGNRRTGWIAFTLAALYAPFYAYSQVLLRDMMGWLLVAGLMLVLVHLEERLEQPRPRRWLSLGAGLVLGLGFLARESFVLIIAIVWSVCLVRFWKRRDFVSPVMLVGGTCLLLLPLMIRNHHVGAPLLSTSNRFPEAFLLGHARGAHPYEFVIPKETRRVMEASGGKTGALIMETLKTQRSLWRYVRFQFTKALSLFDPYESVDNLSFYFVEHVSPLVKWGVKYWMILVPGLGGFLWSVGQRDRRHFWLWVLFPLAVLTVMLSLPLSRYRQPLALYWIPWAACFFAALAQAWAKQPRRAVVMATSLVAGWLLCLGPLARHPRSAYERPYEYEMAAQIYLELGRPEKAEAMNAVLREKSLASRR